MEYFLELLLIMGAISVVISIVICAIIVLIFRFVYNSICKNLDKCSKLTEEERSKKYKPIIHLYYLGKYAIHPIMGVILICLGLYSISFFIIEIVFQLKTYAYIITLITLLLSIINVLFLKEKNSKQNTEQ